VPYAQRVVPYGSGGAAHTCIHTSTLTYTHAHMQRHTHTHTHSQTHSHSHTHLHTHVHVHTYTHTPAVPVGLWCPAIPGFLEDPDINQIKGGRRERSQRQNYNFCVQRTCKQTLSHWVSMNSLNNVSHKYPVAPCCAWISLMRNGQSILG